MMNNPPGLGWVTSFVVKDGQVGAHIENAIVANLALPAISTLVVVTESSAQAVREALPQLDQADVIIVETAERPTFAQLFAQVNTLLQDQDQDQDQDQKLAAVAVANADIALADNADALRLLQGMAGLQSSGTRSAFALTRHDQHSGRRDVSLRNALGLPNVMSADVWVFDQPLDDIDGFYYAPGQMFCDQYLNHDLLVAGYEIYNPCLDCVAVHWELEAKSQAFYKAASQDKNNREAVLKHWREKVVPGLGQYCGIPHTSVAALSAGYRPAPIRMSVRRKKIYLFVSNYLADHPRVSELLAALPAGDEQDVCVVFDSAEQADDWERYVVEQGLTWLYSMQAFSNTEVAKRFLAGGDPHYTNLALTPYSLGLPAQLVDAYDAILVWFQTVQVHADDARLQTYLVHELPASAATLFVDALSEGFQIGISWGRDFRSIKEKHDTLLELAAGA